MSETIKAHLYILLATALIASSFLVSGKLSGIIDPISITMYRFFIAALVLMPIFIKQEYRKRISSTFGRGMIISLFYSLYFIGMFKALESTTVLNTSTLYTLVPLMTAILCIFFFKEKISLTQLFIYFIAMLGTTIVIFKANIELFLNFSLNQGDIIFLLGSISMALYSIFLKFLYKKDDILLVLVFCTLVGGCIWMFLTMQVLDIPLEWEKIDGNLFYLMLYISIVTTVFTLFLYQKGSIVLGSKKLMAYVYLSPAMVAILSFIFDKQSISFGIFVGIIISTFATIVLLKQK
ncbi:EamA/RhaT family transporter [Arcobacter venerupis]|uniref:EamA/RhaT family transporter n=1 Tax=Arcobacter venerupis TaxID=1054033 RepID=A0AAE7BBQ0_9BACT|nr:DMT family transporter [Arcobacter venerupis]QKF67332.1 EamA/RhaT family transporter [Arcobacter venerupis]RWS50652.1 EamA family transporter [Arcobacter venerupis]